MGKLKLAWMYAKSMAPNIHIRNKGQLLSGLTGTFQQITFLAIFGAVMLIILANLRTSVTNTDATNAIDNATRSISNVFAQLPLFGTILGLLLIVGIVFLLIRGTRGGGGGNV